ncbi:MAG: peptide MFS transporter [Sphingomonas sp.]|jgi:POT family proton-dependent oligopeptide transporter|uniref:peptide MFS transporter n=1 Tax=Sphingomonas sp. TaxID=28214 RepID=UPI0035692A3F
MASGASAPAGKTLFGHPPGMTVLFMTQMWAEFSYFGLQALLVYYMTQHLGFSQARSSLIYGTYGAAAFFSPFFGGIIADRWLGRKRSVVLGGVLMMLGHFAMAFEALLFPALALVAIGNGLFIPPLAVQVGNLYADKDPRQTQAFSAYYMGINLGGLLAPLVCGTLGEVYGWHWGFAAAGFGMLVGLGVYLYFGHLLPPDPPTRARSPGGIPVALTKPEWRNLRLLVAIVAVVVLFRIAYEQSGNVIALWVEHETDRHIALLGSGVEIPATWFQSINPLLIILATPFLIRFWAKRAERRGPANLLRRMSLGCVVATLAMLVMVVAAALNAETGQRVGAEWVTAYFILLTLGELMVIPVGLTLVGALSPVQVAAMAMGAWYIAKFLGSLLAGAMGAWWGAIPATMFFGAGALSVALAAAVLFVMSRRTPIEIG